MRCFLIGRGRAPGTPALAPNIGMAVTVPLCGVPGTWPLAPSSSSRFVPLFSVAGSTTIAVPSLGVPGWVDAGRAGRWAWRGVPGPGVPVCTGGGLLPEREMVGLNPDAVASAVVGVDGGKVAEVGVGTPATFPAAVCLASFLSSLRLFRSSRACCDSPTSAVGFHCVRS